MRFSTASLILAYLAAITVHAAPTEQSNGLNARSAELAGAQVARGVDTIELEVRDPKK